MRHQNRVQAACVSCQGLGKVACESCNGTGLSGDVHAPLCTNCGGQGRKFCTNCEGVGFLYVRRTNFRG